MPRPVLILVNEQSQQAVHTPSSPLNIKSSRTCNVENATSLLLQFAFIFGPLKLDIFQVNNCIFALWIISLYALAFMSFNEFLCTWRLLPLCHIYCIVFLFFFLLNVLFLMFFKCRVCYRVYESLLFCFYFIAFKLRKVFPYFISIFL